MSSITDLASSLRVWNNKLIMSAITREELLETIGARLKTVRDEIAVAAARSGRTAESVRLVAVTKTYPAPVLDVARALGLQDSSRVSGIGPVPSIETMSARPIL